jgi:hypothetical protein
MSKGRIGVILLLVASLALGIAMGEINFGLYRSTMPPMAVSSFNQGTAHGAFLFYGLQRDRDLRLAMLAVAIAPAFKSPRKCTGNPAGPRALRARPYRRDSGSGRTTRAAIRPRVAARPR